MNSLTHGKVDIVALENDLERRLEEARQQAKRARECRRRRRRPAVQVIVERDEDFGDRHVVYRDGKEIGYCYLRLDGGAWVVKRLGAPAFEVPDERVARQALLQR